MKVGLAAVTGTRGGPRTYAISLLQALAALGTGDRYALLADQRLEGGLPPDVEQHTVPGGRRATRPLAEALALPVLARRAGLHVLHSTKTTLPRGIDCATVVTVHDLAPFLFPDTFSRVAGAWLRRSTAAAVERADLILAVSHCTAKDVVEVLGARPDRVHVVHNGIDDRFRAPREATAIAAMRERNDLPPRYLLSVGTIQPRKNLDVILDALERLAAAGTELPPLVVAGRVGWLSDAVVERARNSPLVIYRGEIDDSDLPALYAGADVFLSPSSYEGFGLTVGEAMVSGTAVVAGGGHATDEVVGDAGVLVPPRDVDALADAIAALLCDDAYRQDLAERGRAFAARFTWERAARETSELYAAALATRA